jgi:hypothetical protein
MPSVAVFIVKLSAIMPSAVMLNVVAPMDMIDGKD